MNFWRADAEIQASERVVQTILSGSRRTVETPPRKCLSDGREGPSELLQGVKVEKEASRLVPTEQIPSSLWDARRELLSLTDSLAKAYSEVIDLNGLGPLVSARQKDSSPIGGLSQQSANEHFAWAFDGSAARAALAVLDPKADLGRTSDIFFKFTAGTTLVLVDAPCGAGAAALAFLTTVAELRSKGVLPRMPLDVKLVGGEISETSRSHAKDMFSKVATALDEQAIFVDCRIEEWDVLDSTSTTKLVKTMISHGHGCSARMIVVANFSGFLVGEGKQKKAEPQLNELLRYAADPGSFAIWIEPSTNKAKSTGGIFSWIFGRIVSAWNKFTRPDESATAQNPSLGSEASFRLPLNPSQSAQVRLTVMPIELIQGSSS